MPCQLEWVGNRDPSWMRLFDDHDFSNFKTTSTGIARFKVPRTNISLLDLGLVPVGR